MPIRKTPTNSNFQNAALAASTVRTIFTPASNTTGIKIHAGNYFGYESATGYGHFVIATSAPSAMSDGISVSKLSGVSQSANNDTAYEIIPDTFVPAGYGLYWIGLAVAISASTDVSWSPA